jgi:hypothetical protein
MIGSTLKKHAPAIFGAAAISLLVSGGAAFAQADATRGVSTDVSDNCTIAASPTGGASVIYLALALSSLILIS